MLLEGLILVVVVVVSLVLVIVSQRPAAEGRRSPAAAFVSLCQPFVFVFLTIALVILAVRALLGLV